MDLVLLATWPGAMCARDFAQSKDDEYLFLGHRFFQRATSHHCDQVLAVLAGGVSVANELHICTCLGCGASEFACRFAMESFFHSGGAIGDGGDSSDSDCSAIDFGSRHF